MTNELLQKAKECKSVDELLALAKENEYPLDTEAAEELFAQMNTSGELTDEELDSVSGGACQTKMKVNGKSYVVVSSGVACFTGEFAPVNSKIKKSIETGHNDGSEAVVWYRHDNKTLRRMWINAGFSSNNSCASCYNLEFEGGIGYCGKSCK